MLNLLNNSRSLFALLFILFFSFQTKAQGDFGIGLHLGSPVGITAKVYTSNSISVEGLLAWDARRESYFVNVSGLLEMQLDRTDFNIYFGPGVFVGKERLRNTFESGDVFVLGPTGTLGINIFFGQLEVYGQLNPRIAIIERSFIALGGGLGGRFYF